MKAMIVSIKPKWKDVECFNGMYQVSNLGDVRSLDRVIRHMKNGKRIYKGIILTPTIKCGYPYVNLSKLGKVNSIAIHRLVAQAFIPNHENKRTVNHKDGNKTNNCVSNLEWCTYQENHKHAIENKLYNRVNGERSHFYKVTETIVLAIRNERKKGKKIKDVFNEYKHLLKFPGFRDIWYGYRWKHLLNEDK